jgi:chromate transporter
MSIRQKKKLSYIRFLVNVLLLSVTAYGGPQAHILSMQDVLVRKRKYLSDQDLLELNALCQLLPGPTSTQTITAIGYKLGGVSLAIVTLIIWITPACLLMTIFALFYAQNTQIHGGFDLKYLKYLQPISIAFVLAAAYRLGKKTLTNKLYIALAVLAFALSVLLVSPYIYPLALVLAGVAAYYLQQNDFVKQKVTIVPNYRVLWVFFGLLIVAAAIGVGTRYRPALLFENTYRFGSLVFGGGQVLIPMLYDQFVLQKHYLSNQDFLTGYGIVQAIPGPVFSFASYVNALALRQWGVAAMVAGAAIGAVAIFTPGALLVFFVYPVWQQVKTYKGLQKALEGISAAAVGLIATSAVLLTKNVNFNVQYIIALILALALLLITKIPSWAVIILGIIAGLVLA